MHEGGVAIFLAVAMLIVRRLSCIVYWGLLTVLLLAPNPLAVFGITRLPDAISPPDRGVHFSVFCLLTVLVLASRWPVRTRFILIVLVVYAFASELLQYFFPPRTVDPIDLTENLLGIAVGAGFYWGVHKLGIVRARQPALPKR